MSGSLPSTMPAIQWNAATDSLDLVTVPVPAKPGPQEVVIQVAFCGVCGTDLHVILKEFAAAEKVLLGHEFGGVIASVGSEVTDFTKGDRVCVNPNSFCGTCHFCVHGDVNYCVTGGLRSTIGLYSNGGWAAYCRFPAKQAVHIPESMSFRLAALCEPYGCIVNGYNRFNGIPQDAHILVMGAGIIGLLWVSMLHYHGYRDVTIVEVAEGRKALADGLGFGYRVCSPKAVLDEFKTKDADVEGFSIIVDCTGNPKAIQDAFPLLRRGGKMNVFGCCPKKSEMMVNPAEFMLKELTVFGTLINPFTTPAAVTLVGNMGEKYLSYARLGIKEFPLEDYKAALDQLKSGAISKAMFAVADL